MTNHVKKLNSVVSLNWNKSHAAGALIGKTGELNRISLLSYETESQMLLQNAQVLSAPNLRINTVQAQSTIFTF